MSMGWMVPMWLQRGGILNPIRPYDVYQEKRRGTPMPQPKKKKEMKKK